MKTHKREIHESGRLILGSMILAAVLLLASWVQTSPIENETLRVFVTTAVYMLGPLLAALIMLPVIQHGKWLYITATLVSLSMVIPWAFINPSAWAQDYMVQLGSNANMMFLMLMIAATTVECKSTKILWLVTAVYLAILWVMPII